MESRRAVTVYSVLSRPSALARRPEAVEPDCWKYRPRVGARKDRKTSSAPLSKSVFEQNPSESGAGADPHWNLPEGREREPEEEDELEDEVKGEPVDNLNEALDHGKERENDPILEEQLASPIRRRARRISGSAPAVRKERPRTVNH